MDLPPSWPERDMITDKHEAEDNLQSLQHIPGAIVTKAICLDPSKILQTNKLALTSGVTLFHLFSNS